MGVLRLYTDITRAIDKSKPETQIGIKGLIHQAQGLSLGHQEQMAS